MYYQFDSTGKCVSTATGLIEPMDGIISIYCKEVYTDIGNVRLINGEVYHIEEATNAENIIPNA